VLLAGSPAASAATRPSIASLALANVKKMACSVNSQNGKAYESSCTGNNGQPEFWCADFARWVWSEAGVADTSRLNALAGSFYTYGLDYNTLTSVPAVGDAAVFDYYGGGEAAHVAIVTEVSPDGSIETVSGDWGGHGNSEAQFASTSSVVLNAPAYLGTLGAVPDVMGMTVSAFVAPVGVPVTPVLGESWLSGGHGLTAGQTLTSPNGLYSLIMQTDGNLVEETGSRPLWASGTSGTGNKAVVQTDGNLVVETAAGTPLWSSGTGGHSGTIIFSVRDDASMVISDPAGTLWSRRPNVEVENAGQTLLSGQHLVSSNGLYTLIMQSDGNLVEYTAGLPFWATGTQGGAGTRAVMQTDGNLVVYSPTGAALWSSGSGGHSGTINLSLLNNGDLVVNGPAGPLWTNRM
jgi:hypothetical protein